MKLPPIDKELRHNEERQASIRVSVRINDTREYASEHAYARYIHSIDKWYIEGHSGNWKILEWWYLPEAGTGHKL